MKLLAFSWANDIYFAATTPQTQLKEWPRK